MKSVAATLGELVRPGNKSVRLAIVAYARANGIPLKESDFDALRGTLLSGQDPTSGRSWCSRHSEWPTRRVLHT